MNMDFILDTMKLGDIHSNLYNATNELEKYNLEIYEKIRDLGNYWSGPSYTAFEKDAQGFRPSLDDLVELFGNYTEIVDTLDAEGASLISRIAKNLNCDDVTTLMENVYKAEDISDYSDSNLGYGVNLASVENVNDAYKQATDVQYSLLCDKEVIDLEMRNEQNNRAALEANKEKMDPDVYDKLHTGLDEKISYLKTQYSQYSDAYEKVSNITTNKNTDVLDYINGSVNVASTGYFGNSSDTEAAKEGLEQISAATQGLIPISAFVDSTTIGEDLASLNDYSSNLYLNGPSVSKFAMEASFNIAENTENGTSEIAPGVIAFNSKDFVEEGKALTGDQVESSGTQIISQSDAYGIGGTSEEGFDSVRIQKDDGEYEYMTYSQYEKYLHSKSSVDAVTEAAPTVGPNSKEVVDETASSVKSREKYYTDEGSDSVSSV